MPGDAQAERDELIDRILATNTDETNNQADAREQASETQEATAASDESVVALSESAQNLPETGAASVLLPVLAIAVLSYTSYRYLESR